MAAKDHMLAHSQARAFIECLAGSQRGKFVELSLDRLTIGRADDNDIVIAHDSISRHHAVLEVSDEGWFVRDNGSKNGVQVNGQSITEAVLNPGDVVQVGEFVFRFSGNPTDGAAEEHPPMYASGEATVRSRRPLIYGVVVLVLALVFLMNKPSEEKKDGEAATPVSKEEKLARDFQATERPDLKMPSTSDSPKGKEDPILTRAEQGLEKQDAQNTALIASEQSFKKGLREYLTGNYIRAIEEFRASLAWQRNNQMAQKYLLLAMHEAEIAAKIHMENGVRYFDSLQYQRALYHFRQVLDLMAHKPQEKIISDARRYIEVCKEQLKNAELFP